MAKKEDKVVSNPIKYFRLVHSGFNMFALETVVTENDTIVSKELTEYTFFPITVDKMRRAASENFFNGVKDPTL